MAGQRIHDLVAAPLGPLPPDTLAEIELPDGSSRKATLLQAGHLFTGQSDVALFGGIGDGQLHPASERFGTDLAAAKAVYPRCTSLTEQLDKLAHQRMVDVAAAHGGGVGRSNRFHAMHDGPVVYPEATYDVDNDPLGPDGEIRAVVSFVSDLGNGIVELTEDFDGAAFNCRNRQTTSYGSSGLWEGVLVQGKGSPHTGSGNRPCRHRAFDWSARRGVRRLRARDCETGYSVIGDQTLIDDVSTYRCGHGLRIDTPNDVGGLRGDFQANKLKFDENWESAITVSKDAVLDKWTFISLICGHGPWSIKKELGGKTNLLMSGCTFINPQFEGPGLGVLGGGNPRWNADGTLNAQGSARPNVEQSIIISGQYGPWSTRRYNEPNGTPVKRVAMFDLGSVGLGLTLQGINVPTNMTPGDLALFQFVYGGRFKVVGAIDILLAACEAAGVPFIRSQFKSDTMEVEQPGDWKGRVQFYYAPAAASVPVEGSIIRHKSGEGHVTTGSADEDAVAISRETPILLPNEGTGHYVAQYEGFAPVNMTADTTSAQSDGKRIYAGASGKGVLTGPGLPIGTGEGGTYDANGQPTLKVKLRGLH